MSANLRILYDVNLFGIKQMLEHCALDAVPYSSTNEFTTLAHSCDAAIIRTTTAVNEASLPKKGFLKGIATASAGFDHLDISYLTEFAIPYFTAAGSNAQCVAEYVMVSLLKIAADSNADLKKLTLGIVGVGHVGGTLSRMAQSFGLSVIEYDPPKAKLDSTFKSASLEELKKADILSFHVPLTKNGHDSTYHLFSENTFFFTSSFLALINTSRGGVLEERLLMEAKQVKSIRYLVADVWENEPKYDTTFRKNQFIATPHIAGYSVEAKLRASWMSVKQVANLLNIPFDESFTYWVAQLAPKDTTLHKKVSRVLKKKINDQKPLISYLLENHPMDRYQRKLADLDALEGVSKAKAFQALRVQESLRREFGL